MPYLNAVKLKIHSEIPLASHLRGLTLFQRVAPLKGSVKHESKM